MFALQAQQLVQMICYPGGLPEIPEEDDDDDEQEPIQKQIITRILKVSCYFQFRCQCDAVVWN